jgi:hypothetical protein
MSSIMEILRNMQKELANLERIIHYDTIDSKNHLGSSVDEYQLRIKYSKPSMGYRVCCKCRLNKPFRQFSKIDLKKGPGKSVCCTCVKKIFLHSKSK